MTASNVALVTGGSTGIGAEICRQMLDAGYEVVSLSLGASRSSACAAACGRGRPDGSRGDPAGAPPILPRRFPFSHFVHNAGIIRPALLPEVKLGRPARRSSQLHLGAAITLAQAVLPAMKGNQFGRIVLMSSRGALGLQTRTAYSATKAGMIGMARTWALELAADGITVNVVAPGPIAGTEMFHDVVSEGQRAREGAGGGHSGQAAGPQRRCGARRHVLLRPGERLCDRPDALRLRRSERGHACHLATVFPQP